MFNYRNNGDKELQQALGFLNEGEIFKFIEPQIRMMTLELRAAIGATVIDTLIAHYESDSFAIPGDNNAANNWMNIAVELAQSVIAHKAYSKAAPNLDLVHTSSGRKFTQDERMKAAFEHQINRSDEAIQSLEDQAFESLILHLNTDTDNLSGWIGSPAYIAQRDTFFESCKDLQNVVDIAESRKGFKMLLPIIKEVQKNTIKQIIGRSQYDLLLVRWKSRAETDADKALIEAIRPGLAYMAMAKAAIRFGAKFFQDGFFNRHDNALKGMKSLTIAERESISSGYKQDAYEAFRELENYLIEVKINANQEVIVDNPFPVSTPTNKFFRA